MTPALHVSIISHRQGALVQQLLADLSASAGDLQLAVTLTLNAPEPLPVTPADLAMTVLRNARPRGFGANHNAAFSARHPRLPYFCVVNPDIRMGPGVLSALVRTLAAQPSVGVVAPLVHDSTGTVQDSARRLPTPARILRKALWSPGGIDYPVNGEVLQPDWVAGMFMLWRADVFAELSGFDEGYLLYYEDVDLCCRARLHGHAVALDPSVSVIHDGARASHRRLEYMRVHLTSMGRFFRSEVYREAARLPGNAVAGRTVGKPAS